MIDPGSFRDPQARVYTDGERILRGLSDRAAEVDARARGSGLMAELIDRRLMIENERIDGTPTPEGVPRAGVIAARTIPVITYPYEWSFAMMRDAALVMLDLTEACFKAGFGLKDATAYNIAFDGARPVAIDVTALDDHADAWVGYGQFCDHFLAPLMMSAYQRVPFQRALRGHLEGIPITDLAFTGLSRFRRGVPLHVLLRRRLERKAGRMDAAARREVRHASLPREALLRSVRSMRSLIERLEPATTTTWQDYASGETHGERYAQAKRGFVARAAERAGGAGIAWDVGANTGEYTEHLVGHFEHILALDGDPGAVDHAYARFKASKAPVTPAVHDVTDPSPARGWRGTERRTLYDRARPRFAQWLAIVHHLALGRGIPLSEVVALITETSPAAVVEFVGPGDPKSELLLATRSDVHPGYDLATFEQLVSRTHRITDREALNEHRTILSIERR